MEDNPGGTTALKPAHQRSGLSLGAAVFWMMIWAIASWVVIGRGGESEDSGVFRVYAEKLIMVYEAGLENELPPWMMNILEMDDVPETLGGYYEKRLETPDVDDATRMDFSILCHRLMGVDTSRPWAELGREALRGAKRENAYAYDAVVKLWRGEPMTEEEIAHLKETVEGWESDWWFCYVAVSHGASDAVDVEGLQARQETVVRDYIMACYLVVALAVGALVLAWPAWCMLRNVRQPAGHGRGLGRSWRLEDTLGVYACAGLVGVAFYLAAAPTSAGIMSFLAALNVDEMTAWQAGVLVATVMGGLGLAIEVLIMRNLLIPRRKRMLRRGLGLTWKDFSNPRFWVIASFGAVAMFYAFWGLGLLLDAVGVEDDPADGLSRSTSEFGILSLPVGFLWGVVLAPVVEEILFRGFLFRSMQARWGTWAAALVSSLIFSYGHFYSWLGLLHVFLYGLIFAWVYQRTGRLAAAILLHSLNNFILLIFSWLTVG